MATPDTNKSVQAILNAVLDSEIGFSLESYAFDDLVS